MPKKRKQNSPDEATSIENDARNGSSKRTTAKSSSHSPSPGTGTLKVTLDQDRATADTLAAKDKPKKIKMIRDSFTMPESDYTRLAELKKKCLESGIHVKKSELLRAGLLRLSKLNKSALLHAINQVEILKTGRPAKKQENSE